jgi:hypothetical protein
MADRARRYEREVRRRAGVNEDAYRLLAGELPVVRAGPFAGMAYPADRLDDVDAAAAKLLGTYEREIAWVFERAIARGVTTFIDIGCADGYYAVGMPRASSVTTTFAYDLSQSARDLCAETAKASGVEGRVRIGNRCSLEVLSGLPTHGALVLCDIEGAERELLDTAVAQRLAGSVAVVEVHEDEHPGAGNQLTRAFAGTHRAVRVMQRPRTEAPELLPDWSPRARSRALGEFRGHRLHWIVFEPRVA